MKVKFDTVLDEFGPLLSRVASSYEANPDLKDDLVQEICLAVWQALTRFKGDSSLKTYVMRIAHNRAVNHVSYHAKQVDKASYCETEAPVASVTTQTEKNVMQRNKINTLLDAVRELPIQTRQVVTMSMEGLSYQEISEVCGLTSSNVGVILNRAKKQLAETVQHD